MRASWWLKLKKTRGRLPLGMSTELASTFSHLNLSISQDLPENFDAVPLKDNLEIECVDGGEDADEAADVFSVKSTPTHGRSFQTAKKWLGSFLVAVSLYYCAITHAAFSRARTIEIAHILLPQCSPPELVCRD